MAMNFAPYQSSPPESIRAKSPPPLRSPPASPRPRPANPTRNISAVASDTTDPWAAARNQRLPSPSRYVDDVESQGGYEDLEAGPRPLNHDRYNDYIMPAQSNYQTRHPQGDADLFTTSLGLPLHIEAPLAYLIFPPAAGVVLLLFEHKSDYVRFHAWQSALLFGFMFFVHIISSWSSWLSWILFVGDLGMIGYLAFGAWREGGTLERWEVPVLGRLAGGFVDDE